MTTSAIVQSDEGPGFVPVQGLVGNRPGKPREYGALLRAHVHLLTEPACWWAPVCQCIQNIRQDVMSLGSRFSQKVGRVTQGLAKKD